MSESNLVSPLLDGFALGTPMSNHCGVCCCPAMKNDSDQKYIVKIISVPASQTQLDALLVTGAYRDPAAALDYFRQQADDIAAEAEFLQSMAKLEGFVGFEDWQVSAMKQNRLGYQVYLVSKYQRTLEKSMRRNPITHLQAVNMALDMCAALSLCRRAGYLYVDLKPTNIYLGEDKRYRIGDLGFISLSYLKYSSMPEKYFSPYLAPEAKDAMTTLSQTLDTYALGMILYRIYNGNQLPQMPADPADPLPAPAYADEEMSQIILKACAPRPEDRWSEPSEMGQALVAYMQRNTVNDVPICETTEETADTVPAPESAPEPPAPEVPRDLPAYEIVPPDYTEDSAEQAPAGTLSDTTVIPVQQPARQEDPEAAAFDALSQSTMRFEPGTVAAAVKAPASEEAPGSAEAGPAPSAPPADDGFDLDSELSEVRNILKYPAVTPRPVKKPVMQNVTPVVVSDKPRGRGLLAALLVLVLLGGISFFSYWFYGNFYLQTIDGISVTGTQSEMTVTLKTSVDNKLLTVSCTDVYGSSMQSAVTNGTAVFTGLKPNSLYKILVTIDGLHKLTGQVSDVFTTEDQTNVVDFTAIAGQDEGYVVLNITVDGHEPEEWVLSASTEGEDNIMQRFSGHSVTVKGLTVGKEYVFRLNTADGSELAGKTSLKFNVVSLITASNLDVISRIGGDLTVGWDAPANINVESWTVRCYADNYDETQTVTGTIASFTKTSSDKAYTIEVTPAGMTEPTRLTISANPVTIASISATESDEGALELSWTYEGKAPADGWLVTYTLDNSTEANILKAAEASASITPLLPNTTYHITIQAPDNTSIFNNTKKYTTSSSGAFSCQGLSADKITSRLLVTPQGGKWLADDVEESSFTSSFAPGDKISMVVEGTVKFYVEHEDIDVMYVIRDNDGNPLPALVAQETIDWYDLFYDGNYQLGELNIPKVPTKSGSYRVDVYFNNSLVTSAPFTIS